MHRPIVIVYRRHFYRYHLRYSLVLARMILSLLFLASFFSRNFHLNPIRCFYYYYCFTQRWMWDSLIGLIV